MRYVVPGVVGFFLLSLPGISSAQQTAVAWEVVWGGCAGGNDLVGTYYPTPQAAFDAALGVAACGDGVQPSYSGYTCQETHNAWSCSAQNEFPSFFSMSATAPLVIQCDEGFEVSTGTEGEPICVEPPPPCAVLGLSFIHDGVGTPPGSFCNNNCLLTKSGPSVTMDGGWVAYYRATDSCGVIDPPVSQGNNCISTSNGVTYCLDQTNDQENCGVLNGEYLCLGPAQQGDCVFGADGTTVCASGTQANPPDEQIIDENDNVLDVFTGGGSGTGGDTGGGPTTGQGDGSGGTGSGTGDGSCQGSACDGDLPGDNEAVDDFGTLFSTFWGRMEAAPLVQAVSGLAGSMPAGSCDPVVSDPIAFLGNTTLQLDAHCTLWPQLVPIINGVMLAAWSLLGAIILFRA